MDEQDSSGDIPPPERDSQHPLRVFLCYAPDDESVVRNLYDWLQSHGIHPWMKGRDLLPGKDVTYAIEREVEQSSVVIACLSQSFVSQKGLQNKEIKLALDVADEQPEGTISVIPAKLEACDVPHRLKHLQSVNLFEMDSYERLLSALRTRQVRVDSRSTLPSKQNPSSLPPPPDTEQTSHHIIGKVPASMRSPGVIHPQGVIRTFLAVFLLALIVFIAKAPLDQWLLSFPDNSSFDYPVRVQDEHTGENIPNAKVTIEVGGGIAPLDDFTDSNGFTRITIDSSRANKRGKLIVEKERYEKKVQEIDLRLEQLPDIIRIEPQTPPSSPTPTPTIEDIASTLSPTSNVNVIITDFGVGLGWSIHERLKELDDLDNTSIFFVEHDLNRTEAISLAQQVGKGCTTNLVISGNVNEHDQVIFFDIDSPDPPEYAEVLNEMKSLTLSKTDEREVAENVELSFEPVLRFMVGLVYLFDDEPSEAAPEFNAAIDFLAEMNYISVVRSNDALSSETFVFSDTLYFFKGRALFLDKQYERALEAFSTSLTINPYYSWSHLGQGAVYYDQFILSEEPDVQQLALAREQFEIARKGSVERDATAPKPAVSVLAKAYVNIGNVYTAMARRTPGNQEEQFQMYADGAYGMYQCALYLYGEHEERPPGCEGDRSGEDTPPPYRATTHLSLGLLYKAEGKWYEQHASTELAQERYRQAQGAFEACLELVPEACEHRSDLNQICLDERREIQARITDQP